MCNPRWQAEKPGHLARRLQRTQVCLEGLPTRLGTRALTRREAIAQALEATLTRDHTGDWLTSRLVATETTRKPSRGRGRAGTGAFYEEGSAGHWTVHWPGRPDRIDQAN